MDVNQLRKQLEEFDIKPQKEQVGQVIAVQDGIVQASGLSQVENFELVEFSGKNALGLAINLQEYQTGIIVLGDYDEIGEGDTVTRTKKLLSLPVGESLVGRIVNPLGEPLDGKGPLKASSSLPIERPAPSVIDRESVKTPLHTGVLAVDSLVPIGRGQRELIIGDRGIGKTAIAFDAILNQKHEKDRPVCVYVVCGQKKSKVKRLVKTLEEKGAMEYSVVVAAFADDPSSFVFLAPYAGVTIGEYFMQKGKDALCVYDDLTKQAWAWREISLVLRRPPGREAYPGDVFFLHSRLLERAAKLSKEKGGGSLTALPIIETQAGDISGYIPTNVISICDGQIAVESNLFHKGQRPAIDVGKSVSRVGSSAQRKAMKKIAGTLRLDLAQFQELERFSEFTEELDAETKKIVEQGRKMRELLRQQDMEPLPFEKEVVLLFAGVKGFLKDVPSEKIQEFKKELLEEFELTHPELLKALREKGELDEKMEKEMREALEKFTA